MILTQHPFNKIIHFLNTYDSNSDTPFVITLRSNNGKYGSYVLTAKNLSYLQSEILKFKNKNPLNAVALDLSKDNSFDDSSEILIATLKSPLHAVIAIDISKNSFPQENRNNLSQAIHEHEVCRKIPAYLVKSEKVYITESFPGILQELIDNTFSDETLLCRGNKKRQSLISLKNLSELSNVLPNNTIFRSY